jgi:hypothetical protein
MLEMRRIVLGDERVLATRFKRVSGVSVSIRGVSMSLIPIEENITRV